MKLLLILCLLTVPLAAQDKTPQGAQAREALRTATEAMEKARTKMLATPDGQIYVAALTALQALQAFLGPPKLEPKPEAK